MEYELGGVSALEKLNAQARKNELLLIVKELDFDVAKCKEALKQLSNADTTLDFRAVSMDQIFIEGASETTLYQLMFEQNLAIKQTELSLNKNTLLPSIHLAYYNGSNTFADAKHYHGYTVGLGIPIFFAEQRSKIKSGKIGLEMEQEKYQNFMQIMKATVNEWQLEVQKQNEYLKNYQEFAQPMYEELMKATQTFRSSGEIGIYQYIISLETAVKIQLDYLNSLWQKQNAMVELKYLNL